MLKRVWSLASRITVHSISKRGCLVVANRSNVGTRGIGSERFLEPKVFHSRKRSRELPSRERPNAPFRQLADTQRTLHIPGRDRPCLLWRSVQRRKQGNRRRR